RLEPNAIANQFTRRSRTRLAFNIVINPKVEVRDFAVAKCIDEVATAEWDISTRGGCRRGRSPHPTTLFLKRIDDHNRESAQAARQAPRTSRQILPEPVVDVH